MCARVFAGNLGEPKLGPGWRKAYTRFVQALYQHENA